MPDCTALALYIDAPRIPDVSALRAGRRLHLGTPEERRAAKRTYRHGLATVRDYARKGVPYLVACLARDLSTGSARGLALDLAEIRRAVWLTAYPGDWMPGEPDYSGEVVYCESCGLPVHRLDAVYPEDEDGRSLTDGPLCEGCYDDWRMSSPDEWEAEPCYGYMD